MTDEKAPEQAQGQQVRLTHEQVAAGASAGLQLLAHPDGSVPNPLRKGIDILEVVLSLIASGKAVLATPEEGAVPSGDAPPAGDKTAGRTTKKKVVKKKASKKRTRKS